MATIYHVLRRLSERIERHLANNMENVDIHHRVVINLFKNGDPCME